MDRTAPMLDVIVEGECLSVMKELPDNCIDLTVTSPPYDNLRQYHGYTFDFEGIAKELFRITKSGGVVVWVVGDATIDGSETGTSFRQALYFKEIGFKLHDTMIYHRETLPSVDIMHHRYYQHFEYMFVLCKDKPISGELIKTDKKYMDDRVYKGGQRTDSDTRAPSYRPSSSTTKIKSNVWKYSVGGGHVTTDDIAYQHPAIFPEQLAADHILSWSNPGDLILDPMCGSGTTCKMAKYHQRHFIGIDISKEYCDISRRRVNSLPASLSRWAEG